MVYCYTICAIHTAGRLWNSTAMSKTFFQRYMESDITSVPWRLKSMATREYVQQLIQAKNKEKPQRSTLLVLCEGYPLLSQIHDDVIKWKHFPRYWPFVRGIHRSPVNSPHKGQWRGAFVFSLICAWINGWVTNHEAGDLGRHRAHYDVIVMHLWYGERFQVMMWPCSSHSLDSHQHDTAVENERVRCGEGKTNTIGHWRDYHL